MKVGSGSGYVIGFFPGSGSVSGILDFLFEYPDTDPLLIISDPEHCCDLLRTQLCVFVVRIHLVDRILMQNPAEPKYRKNRNRLITFLVFEYLDVFSREL